MSTFAIIVILLVPVLNGYLHRLAKPNLPRLEPAYDFSLVNQDGKFIRLGALNGKVVLLTFIYTQCNTSCPVITNTMVQIQNQLKKQNQFGSNVEFVSVTLDPSHDTKSVLDAYAREVGADSKGWSFLTGNEDSIQKVLTAYGVYSTRLYGNQLVHSTVEFLIDQRGMVRKTFGMDISVNQTVQDVDSLIGRQA
jgi:protein SCO1